jgi:uncharacterized pyridoxal phosphate-containing UPF0001 family protein
MLQVNVSGEASKSGCDPADAATLAEQIAELPNMTLSGFMTIGLTPIFGELLESGRDQLIPEVSMPSREIANSNQIAEGYALLRTIRDAAMESGLEQARELSMGMSADYDLAIAQGATIVRIGSAVFGMRPVG